MGGGPQAAPASLPSRGPAAPPALLGQSRTKRVCSAGAPEQAKTKQNKGLGACSVVPCTGDTDKKRTKHIAKHWHFVKEKCAAGLVVLKYLETALQVADMFTKQIFPKHFERLRRVMMGHENFDDMRARYVQVKASGDDMDDPKLYVDSKPGRPPK